MNKREAVLKMLDPEGPQSYVPAAFFLHFDPQYHQGQAAVDKHLEYFRQTDMDFVKIQFENPFPIVPSIQQPGDWDSMPFYDVDFYAEQLAVVEGIVKAVQPEALIVMTLYSAFMCAGQSVPDGLLTRHLNEDAAKVQPGLETIAKSLQVFVRECMKIGIDGFYASTQGGETGRFDDPSIFETYIKPVDLMLMNEFSDSCPFNILHVCDYHLGYDDLTPFLDYPGHVVNSALKVGDKELTTQELYDFFGRPFMGGMDRHGAIAKGDDEAIVARVEELLADAPHRYIVAADCTIPSDTDWNSIRLAIDTAHKG